MGSAFLAVLVGVGALAVGISASLAETRLYNDLLNGYNPLERPVENASQPLVVKIKMFLQQILDVDEKNQLISVNAWLSYSWQDYKLVWDPTKYDGIENVRFPGTADHIWKPDILLYNSAAEDFDSTYKSNLLVYATGDVNWIPPGVLKFVCKLDVTWFPFDDQICEMKFGSWTFHGDAIDLQIQTENTSDSHSMDLSTYVVNGEWDLISSPALREVKYYKCCPEPYPTVKYFLHLRRRTLYYGFNLIIPSLLICLMTVLGFSLPPDAGEKITLEMTILLAIVFFLSMVSEMTPPTSDAVPLIGVFFSCCMLVISASVVFTVLILNLHFRGPDTHEMSPIMHKVFMEWLPWILCMSRPGYTFIGGVAIADELPLKTKMERLPIDDFPATNPVIEAQIALLHKVYDEVSEICAYLEKEEKEERVQADWKFAAMAVDRACLIMFTVFIVLSTVAIFLSAPHIVA
ncbi:Cation transporter family protein [Teladorsagia circumcincta]|uniref:Cation transporter family protein n=1 Tax=Teladorsagia circumcincta TaxID=45464 RepID=A0A2G9UVX3_TELCI|nr:Cation transporter family protein [Teladorsagia circumcincta]